MTTAAPQNERWYKSGFLIYLPGFLALIVLWELVAQGTDGKFIFAGPSAIATYALANASLLLRSLTVTLQAAAWGFLWGNTAAIVLAVIVLLLPRFAYLIASMALVAFCLPLVATGPILRVIFGPGDMPQIVLAALAVYYTTFLSLLVGLRAIPSNWSDLINSYGRGAWTQLVYVRAMASAPYFLSGLQIAAPAAFLGAMIGEFTGAERGLGVLSIRAMRSLDITAIWTIAALASLVSIVAYGALGSISRWLTRSSPPPLLLSSKSVNSSLSIKQQGMQVLLLVIVVLVLWQVTMDGLGLNKFFAKRPGDVWNFLVTVPEAAAHRAKLFAAFAETFAFLVPGYFMGLALGALLAMLVVLLPFLATSVLPVAIALRSIPIVTTAPLLVYGLGRGAFGTITIVAVMIFFPTLVSCLKGLRQRPGQIDDVFTSYASSKMRLLVHAQIPAMMPAFLASARMAVPAGVLAATTAEWLATGNGIGGLIATVASTSDYNMLWSATALLTTTAGVLYALLASIERAVLKTYAPEQLS